MTRHYADVIAKIDAGKLKALSIKQPYPHHIFNDGKDVENRDWPTRGRGWIIIHAGVSKSELAISQIDLPRGGIVGLARIVDCVTEMDSCWFFGLYGFVLRDAFPVPLIPCRGALGFFQPPDEAMTALREHLRNAADLEAKQ
ncbi:MAG: hypothetical protein ACR2O7_03085 [Parasphingorhabdus sp.]